MRLDDAGHAAGADVRARFDGLPGPPLDLRPVTPRGHRHRGALAGLAVAIAVVLVALLVAPWTIEEHAADHPGGTWRRLRFSSVGFGDHGRPSQIITGGPGFVAIGTVTHPERFCVVECDDAVIWESTDAKRWRRARMDAPLRPMGAFTGVARVGRSLVATTSHRGLWFSADGRSWRPVTMPTLPPEGLNVYPRSGPRGFVVNDTSPIPSWTTPTWTSSDGRTWAISTDIGTSANPIGLPPAAPLRDTWLALGPQSLKLGSPEGEAPFTSDDGVHWARLPGATVPDRLSLPLASNHRRTRVFGIQYEAQGTVGGRLWSTRDGATWTEVRSFHDQMPVANPDHLVQSGRWWVLGGNTGTPQVRRNSMWTSPDLRHWYEMPARLHGPSSSGGGVFVAAHDGMVVGLGVGEGRPQLWTWTPPD